MPKITEGCATPSPGPITSTKAQEKPSNFDTTTEVIMEQARVGKSAPDFELTAFVGEGFKNVRLSDYKSKWIVVCFYPGDFTFV